MRYGVANAECLKGLLSKFACLIWLLAFNRASLKSESLMPAFGPEQYVI